MLLNLIPQEFNYVDLFEKQISYAVNAAQLFKEIASKGEVTEELLSKMREIEHQGDEAAHTIIEQLNKTFITPFDREDIHALVREIDDITDMLNTVVNRLKVYKITGVNKNLTEFASTIEKSVQAVSCAVKGLHNTNNTKAVAEYCVEVNRLENVGDTLRDNAIGELFESEKDPIKVIKWKEIFQEAETILDVCEDVAHIVSSILVKQA